MEKKENKKEIKEIFIPAVILSIFLFSSHILFYLARRFLMTTEFCPPQIPILQSFTITPQILFALLLLVLSKYRPFEKVFRDVLWILIGIASLLGSLVFFKDSLQLREIPLSLEKMIPEGMFEVYKPLICNWTHSLFYIFSSLLSFNIFSLLVWGLINRMTTISEGIRYYLPLAFILGGVGAFTTNLGTKWAGLNSWPFMRIVVVAIFLMICALITFNWAWKKLPEDRMFPKEPSPNLPAQFPFLSGAYLLSGALMMKHFLDIIFKVELKTQILKANDYYTLMERYSVLVSSSTILISALWVVLGTWLIRKKGWRSTATYGAVSILLGGFVFLSVNAIATTSWINQGIYTGLLTGTTTALFFPLIQILYLCLPYQKRFGTKVLTEALAAPLLQSTPSLIVQGLIVAFGSLNASLLYFKILVPAFMILLMIAPRKNDFSCPELERKDSD